MALIWQTCGAIRTRLVKSTFSVNRMTLKLILIPGMNSNTSSINSRTAIAALYPNTAGSIPIRLTSNASGSWITLAWAIYSLYTNLPSTYDLRPPVRIRSWADMDEPLLCA